MARLTGDNNKDVYLPYKSTEQIIQETIAEYEYRAVDEPIREAIEQHEAEVKIYGWAFFAAFFFCLVVHDAILYYVFCKVF